MKQLAVVYDVGYDSRMITKRKNMVTLPFLVAIKKNSQDTDRQKYRDFEAHCHI